MDIEEIEKYEGKAVEIETEEGEIFKGSIESIWRVANRIVLERKLVMNIEDIKEIHEIEDMTEGEVDWEGVEEE